MRSSSGTLELIILCSKTRKNQTKNKQTNKTYSKEVWVDQRAQEIRCDAVKRRAISHKMVRIFRTLTIDYRCMPPMAESA